MLNCSLLEEQREILRKLLAHAAHDSYVHAVIILRFYAMKRCQKRE